MRWPTKKLRLGRVRRGGPLATAGVPSVPFLDLRDVRSALCRVHVLQSAGSSAATVMPYIRNVPVHLASHTPAAACLRLLLSFQMLHINNPTPQNLVHTGEPSGARSSLKQADMHGIHSCLMPSPRSRLLTPAFLHVLDMMLEAEQPLFSARCLCS
jgi:hypothetical protein